MKQAWRGQKERARWLATRNSRSNMSDQLCKAPDDRVGMARRQFNEVQSAEIPQIAAACAELGESAGEHYAPNITFSAPAPAPACPDPGVVIQPGARLYSNTR